MQIKTIEKNLRTKMEDWLKSITDEPLRKKVRENLMVSGGSITSMLLNEKINDYDVYIKDIDVLKKLVQYYINGLNSEIEILDGRKKDNLVQNLEDAYGLSSEEIKNSYSIAIHNLKPDQIKLFFLNGVGGMKINENTPKEELNYFPLYYSPNAISLSDDIQIVNRFHGDDKQIHTTFDFVHATNYFTFKSGLVTNKEALESIITKQLRYQGSLYPLTSIIRMKKFIKRGWNINAGEILKIMFQISELDLKDPNVLEEQLIGVDVAYFDLLIKILKGANKKTLTSEFLNTIIDKVFNSADDS